MSEFSLSKKGERNVSSFVGQELLYDYLCGELDSERREALEKLLNENRELKAELEKIRDGLRYVTGLQKTDVAPGLAESIRTPSTYFHVLLQKTRFMEWPNGVKLVSEGLLIAIASLIVILGIPWGRVISWRTAFDKGTVILSEVTKTANLNPDADFAGEAGAPSEETKDLVYEDEAKSGTKPGSKAEVQNDSKESTKHGTKSVEKPIEVKPVVAGVKVQMVPASTDSNPSTQVKTDVESATTVESGKKQGFLFRGVIEVTNIEAINPKLIEFITAAGGRKAGEVELGWKKEGGSYFHFTIPEAKTQQLIELFNEYGKIKISKEPHSRVMSDGIVRYIITVNEKR